MHNIIEHPYQGKWLKYNKTSFGLSYQGKWSFKEIRVHVSGIMTLAASCLAAQCLLQSMMSSSSLDCLKYYIVVPHWSKTIHWFNINFKKHFFILQGRKGFPLLLEMRRTPATLPRLCHTCLMKPLAPKENILTTHILSFFNMFFLCD
jgi:hypothetical protein